MIAEKQYDQAILECKTVLGLSDSKRGDEALLLTGVIFAHPKNPNSDRKKSIETFESLMKRYPNSDHLAEAELYVFLLCEIKNTDRKISSLNTTAFERQKEINRLQEQLHDLRTNVVEKLRSQLDNLKKVDLGIEEDKRKNLPH